MKCSTSLGLATALFLLVTASQGTPPPAQAPQPGPAATNTTAPAGEDAAAAAQRELQENAGQARRGIEELLRRLPAKPVTLAGELQTVQRNQRRLETLARTAVGLLALTALLAAASLALALQQRRALGALGSQEKHLGERDQEGAQETLAAPEADESSGPGEGAASDLSTLSGTAADATGGEPAPAAQDTAKRVAGSAAESAASPAADDDEALLASLPTGMRHREVALLLARLCREAPRLAERFADSELRKRFRGELDAPVHARLNRLIALSEQDDELLRERWLGPDLVTTLDALARFYSEAVTEERNGHATGLARELHDWLYDSFDSVCRDEGWFAIDRIEPYKTRFNPQIHYAVAGRDIDGAEGQIIAIKAIGRRDARTRAVKHQAEVIVGR